MAAEESNELNSQSSLKPSLESVNTSKSAPIDPSLLMEKELSIESCMDKVKLQELPNPKENSQSSQGAFPILQTNNKSIWGPVEGSSGILFGGSGTEGVSVVLKRKLILTIYLKTSPDKSFVTLSPNTPPSPSLIDRPIFSTSSNLRIDHYKNLWEKEEESTMLPSDLVTSEVIQYSKKVFSFNIILNSFIPTTYHPMS
jgi:hypothetical protein